MRNDIGNNRNEKKGSRSSTPHERTTPNTGRGAPNPAAIQQLQFQQQQLISQLQLVQQKILMVYRVCKDFLCNWILIVSAFSSFIK